MLPERRCSSMSVKGRNFDANSNYSSELIMCIQLQISYRVLRLFPLLILSHSFWLLMEPKTQKAAKFLLLLTVKNQKMLGNEPWRHKSWIAVGSFSYHHVLMGIITEVWGDFAYTPTKLTHEKRKDPVKETLSKASGNTLYDKISITGWF